jgi:hypothetical protein
MLQSLKKILGILLLALGLQTSWAFSLLGPSATYPGVPAGFGDSWQVVDIAYNPIPNINGGIPPFFADTLQTGPKNIGEEYRRNTPVMYYACDSSFLDFFGSSGSAAVDQAFTILNNSLTNVDGYSPALTEFPLNSQGENFKASALGLLDVKSKTLALMVEQLGLADSIRYVWCLHNRYQPPGTTCPVDTTYQVVMRNFDITASPLNQVQYSPYVNGSLYTYLIDEDCGAPGSPPDADALEILVDPLVYNPPVASLNEAVLLNGAFFTGLTRDDEAGLRYLLTTNNVLYESPFAGSTLVSSTGVSGGTNYGAPFLLYSSNYTAFAEAALTNDPITLSNLYPGLIINSYSNYFVVVYTTNYFIAYYTNQIGAPVGSPQIPVTGQTVTPSVVTDYSYNFANVFIFTNGFSNNSTATLLTTNVQQKVGSPAGTLITNVTSSPITLAGVPSGDYYIWTNPCGPNLILYTILTNPVVAITNATVVSTNSSGYYSSQTLITYSTTHVFVAEPIICGNVSTGGTATNTPGLYQGIGKMQFIKTSYDSLIGQFYQPVTNTYTMVRISNNQSANQTYQRVVTQPDFLFTAADLLPGPAAINSVNPVFTRSLSFQFNFTNGLAGPGVINPGSTITYNKVGPVYLNTGTAFLNQYEAGLDDFIWGSFDGTTNDPVVYPNGTSLANLANEVLVNLTPAGLPVGTNGVAYATTTFVATGGPITAPFTWSLPSGGLPTGLTLSSGGTISGTPTQSGTFDFILELTDSLSRTVTWSYSITIN